jgi:hypothetical protein
MDRQWLICGNWLRAKRDKARSWFGGRTWAVASISAIRNGISPCRERFIQWDNSSTRMDAVRSLPPVERVNIRPAAPRI